MSHTGQAPHEPLTTAGHSGPSSNHSRQNQSWGQFVEEHSYFLRLQKKVETGPEGYKSHNLIKLFKIQSEH